MPGPAPKPASKRRRYTKPKSYGSATPTTAPAAVMTDSSLRVLGIDNPHPLITGLWDTVQQSCEAAFYSDCDWARLKLELWFANHTMTSDRPSGQAWMAVQKGFGEMLLSPAVKRRAGIEVKPSSPDADADAAVSIVGRYKQQVLKSV